MKVSPDLEFTGGSKVAKKIDELSKTTCARAQPTIHNDAVNVIQSTPGFGPLQAIIEMLSYRFYWNSMDIIDTH